MRRTLTDGFPGCEFEQMLASFAQSAWRFEAQPAYWVGYERKQFDLFLAGEPEPADRNADFAAWFTQIAGQVADGKTIGRVRIVEEPPTDYQRWMLWMDRWNTEAGETIQYLTRNAARAAGLPVDDGRDWWLFDDRRLMVMYFDDEHRRVRVELLEGEPEVEQALEWRRIAIEAATAEAAARHA